MNYKNYVDDYVYTDNYDTDYANNNEGIVMIMITIMMVDNKNYNNKILSYCNHFWQSFGY